MRKLFILSLCFSTLAFSACSPFSLLDPIFNYFLFRGDTDLPEDDFLSEERIIVDGFQLRVPEEWTVLEDDEGKTLLSVPDENNEVNLSVSIDPLDDFMVEELPEAYFVNPSGLEFQMEVLFGPFNSVAFKYGEDYYGLYLVIKSDEPIPELQQGEMWNPSVSMGYDRLKLILEQMYKYMEPVQ